MSCDERVRDAEAHLHRINNARTASLYSAHNP